MKSKKIFTFIFITVFVVFMSATLFTACNESSHTHSYDQEWEKDSSYHWHECSCGEKFDIQEHYPSTSDSQNCETCGYEMNSDNKQEDDENKDNQSNQDPFASVSTTAEYKICYYQENINDDKYTLFETINKNADIGSNVSATIKEYNYFTYNELISNSEGVVKEDGSLVLHLYYTRNKYSLSINDSNFGKISSSGSYKYTSQSFNITATEYLGCEFLGWYSNDELISSSYSYTYTPNKNVVAKFAVTQEMEAFYFTATTSSCEITGLKDENATEINIPDCVTKIDNYAFNRCYFLKSINIPESITNIGDYAFYYCYNLTSLTIPKYVKSIGYCAFAYCYGLTELSILCEKSDFYIGDYAFYDCYSLANVTCPSGAIHSLTKSALKNIVLTRGDIPVAAFSECTNLTNVTINEGIKVIGNYAFADCVNLVNVVIPSTVTSIGYRSFAGCTSITNIPLHSEITEIGAGAFIDCISLTSVNIPTKLDVISNYTFARCESLTSVYIPNNITRIDQNAFEGCTGLTDITLHNEITTIGTGTFKNCSSLTSVNIPTGISLINNEVFSGCASLTSVYIPNNVTIIGYYAFNGCESLQTINIHEEIVAIGEFAFEGCTSLTNIYINDLTHWLKLPTVRYLMEYYDVEKYLYLNNSLLTEVVIPNEVTLIYDYAFKNCNSLTSLQMHSNVTYVGIGAFTGCNNFENISCTMNALSRISTKNVVTLEILTGSVSDYKFSNNSKLTNVTLGSGVTSIGEFAFKNCINLTNFSVTGDLNYIGYGAFDGCENLEYYTYYNGKYLGCAQNRYVALIDTVSDDITNISLPTGVKVIYSNALDNTNIASIEIPNSVVHIGAYAFSGCKNLAEINLPTDITVINEGTFAGCEMLDNVVIKDGITTIENYAFLNCVSLSSIDLPTSVTSIGDYAFANSDIKEIIIKQTVDTVGSKVFYGCNGIDIYCVPTSKPSNWDSTWYGSDNVNVYWYSADNGYGRYWIYGDNNEIITRCHHNTVETLPYIAPTCASNGLTEGRKCTICNEMLTAQMLIASLPHKQIVITEREETVTLYSKTNATNYPFSVTNYGSYIQITSNNMYKNTSSTYKITALEEFTLNLEYMVSSESGCDYLIIKHNSSQIVKVSGTGYSYYRSISVYMQSGDTLTITYSKDGSVSNGSDRAYVKLLTMPTEVRIVSSETWVNIDESFISCEHDVICDVCHNVVFERAPHQPIIDEAVEPTCTQTGLTQGSHCSVCNEVVDAQEIVDALGHTEVIDEAVEPTCTQTGLTQGSHCLVCNEVLDAQEIVDALGHTEVIDEAVDPTCLETGLTQGSHSSVCGEILVEQEIVDALGHKKIVITERNETVTLYSKTNATNYPFSVANYGSYIQITSNNKSDSSSSTYKITALETFTLYLEYMVSSENNYDFLTIKHNSSTIVNVSGEYSYYTSKSVYMQSGDTLTITYSKDYSVSRGNDCAYVKLLTMPTEVRIVSSETWVNIDESFISGEHDVICDVCHTVVYSKTE